jgi:Putative phage serine protease XkdF
METKKLPIYKMMINDDDESSVSFVALVDRPATERNFFAFNKQMKFKTDPQRKIITGALIVADLPIYRVNDKIGEFYVVFDKNQVEKIVQKFFRQHNTSNVNEMHDSNLQVDGVYMFESFIIDSKRGINVPDGFTGITEGSWMGSYKIDNPEIWNKVLDGTFQGFSVEGMFDMEMENISVEQQIMDTIDEIANL